MKSRILIKITGLACLLLMGTSCVLENEDAILEFTERAGTAFTDSPPSIETDHNNQIHILVNLALLYKKENADQSTNEMAIRGTTTYHYHASGASIKNHSFKNMMDENKHHALIRQAANSEKLYAVIQDLSKSILYSHNEDHWRHFRSVSFKIDKTYQFNLPAFEIYGDDVYVPFFSEWNFGGLQINDKRIINRHFPDSISVKHSFRSFKPQIFDGIYHLPIVFDYDSLNRHKLYLYRAYPDTIQQELIRTDSSNYHALIAQVDSESRLFVYNTDSLVVYKIEKNKTSLLSSTPLVYELAMDQGLAKRIDNKGCVRILAPKSQPKEPDKPEQEATPKETLYQALFLSSLCPDTTGEPNITTKITVPDSLKGYHFSPYTSFSFDKENNTHIAAILKPPSQQTNTENLEDSDENIGYKTLMSAKLYHITQKDGEWLFRVLDKP